MEDFVSFEVAKKLKEKGFREGCFGYYGYCEDVFYYNVIQNPVPSRQLTFKDFEECQNTYRENNRYDAPTISQVLKWLREKGVDIYCTPYWHNKTDKYYVVCIVKDRLYNYGAYIDDNDFNNYESAALAGIEYSLDNLI